MKRTQALIYLKRFLDLLEVRPLEDYFKLDTYLQLQRLKKGCLLRPAGVEENYAHFVVVGMLALEQDRKIVRIYMPTEVAFDLESYWTQSESPYQLRALQSSYVITVSRSSEERILRELPVFQSLSQKILERAMKSDQEWIGITQMHYSEAIPRLKERMGQQFQGLSDKRTGQMLGVSTKTISRYKKRMFENRKSIAVRAQAREIFNYPFASIVHGDVEEVDAIVCVWAAGHRLLPNLKAISKYQKMKMTWLSARLYPEARFEKSIWLAKLYAFLFIMDDFTDATPKGQKSELWKEMEWQLKAVMSGENPGKAGQSKSIRAFRGAFMDLWRELQHLASEPQVRIFRDNFLSYVRENCWEACNRDFDKPIPLSVYLEKRPLVSGGDLALNLVQFALEDDYPDILSVWPFLRQYLGLASKLIYSSNDLLSNDKERFIGDVHNWIILLVKNERMTEEEATNHLLEVHAKTLKAFLEMDRKFLEDYTPQNRTLLAAIKNIKYQVSGAVAWSVVDTRRYTDYG